MRLRSSHLFYDTFVVYFGMGAADSEKFKPLTHLAVNLYSAMTAMPEKGNEASKIYLSRGIF